MKAGLFTTGIFQFISGQTVSGDNFNGAAADFTTITGTVITASSVDADRGTFTSLQAENLSFSGDQIISGDFTVVSGATISGTLGVTGEATFASGVTIEGTLDVSGDVSVNDLASTGTISGVTITGTSGFIYRLTSRIRYF